MAISTSDFHRPTGRHRIHNIIKITMAAACLSLAAAPTFAGTKAPPTMKTTAENKPLWPQARNKVRVSGSAYVCLPSGFGQKGRCVRRASLL